MDKSITHLSTFSKKRFSRIDSNLITRLEKIEQYLHDRFDWQRIKAKERLESKN